jgi:DNA repair exonuclease SbcCD ATPase subunit
MAAGVGQYGALLAAKAGLLDPDDAQDLSNALENIFDSGQQVNRAALNSGRSLRQKVAAEIDEMKRRGDSPQNVGNILGRVDRVVGRVEQMVKTGEKLLNQNGTRMEQNAARAEKIIQDSSALLRQADEASRLVPEAKKLIEDIRKSKLGWFLTD